MNTGMEVNNIQAQNLIVEGRILNAIIVNSPNGKTFVKGKPGAGIVVEQLPKTIIKKNKKKGIENDFLSVSDYSFSRELYKDLLDWKNDVSNHYVLMLRGARQVGKTYLLKMFGKQEFKRVIYIDLSFSDGKFFSIYNKLLKIEEYGTDDEDNRRFLCNLLKLYDSNFEDSLDTLIIFDEIQESYKIYNMMRSFRRNLKSRVAFTGSYIGLTQQSNLYKTSAGDYTTLTLNSLSYKEFLNACGIYKRYSSIKEIRKSDLSEEDYKICQKVEELYDVYLQIGGYPDVIKAYLRNKNIEDSKKVIENLLESFYEESSRYFSNVIEKSYFETALRLTAQDIIRRTGDFDLNKDTLIFSQIGNEEIRRSEKISCLKWLVTCNIIGVCNVFNDLNSLVETSHRKYFFMDLGFLNYFVESLLSISESDKKGVSAENFVFLYLNSLLNNPNILKGQKIVSSFEDKQRKLEIDFIIVTKNSGKVGIEVKANKGSVFSSDTALKEGKINKVIKMIKRYGDVYGNKITIPIFMIDKMNKYL